MRAAHYAVPHSEGYRNIAIYMGRCTTLSFIITSFAYSMHASPRVDANVFLNLSRDELLKLVMKEVSVPKSSGVVPKSTDIEKYLSIVLTISVKEYKIILQV